MKFLQIYDHNGELQKEFEVYVDGEDFSWVADKPEAIWLGTIKLAPWPSMHSIEPTPELAPYVPPLPHAGERIALPPELEPKEVTEEEVEKLIEKTQTAIVEKRKEAEKARAAEEAEIESQVPFMTQGPVIEPELEERIEELPLDELVENEDGDMVERKEVKHEPKKSSPKRSRKKGPRSPDSPKGSKAVPKGVYGGIDTSGDR